MKKVLLMFLFVLILPVLSSANQVPEGAEPYKKSETCKMCHPAIYKEWQSSMHSQSSLLKDKAHAAMHAAYSNFKKKTGQPVDYHCGNCHTPMADKLADFKAGKAIPTGSDWKESEGVGCTFCHRIDSIIHNKMYNSYKINKDGALAVSNPSGNSKHKTVKNPIFGNGSVCMGCHSHMVMRGVSICVARDEGEVGDCTACHMEKVAGKPALMSKGKTQHKSHLMGGGHSLETLKKAVKLDAKVAVEFYEESENMETRQVLKVDLTNVITHGFPSTNPMRMAFLKVTAKDASGKVVYENFKKSPMEDKKRSLFMKVFTDGKNPGVPPWLAKGIAMDTRIKNGEKRSLSYPLPEDVAIESISVALIYRLFPPKAINMMGVPKNGYNEKNHVIAKKMIKL